MRLAPCWSCLPVAMSGLLALTLSVPTRAQGPADSEGSKAPEPAQVDLLKGVQSGSLAAEAKGIGDGRITISVSNRTSKPLKVILPSSLIASGASGQFGGGGMGGMGMGGMGGGMGGMGMGGMGGGMGGMGGGMGGMGGGMGGMGGGMGGMGGGMGGGMMGGGTMPPMMGMMLLRQLIMQLCGDKDSWDQSSPMGMMGGMGMGGMGMGGRGGAGGMGGGFRSVPVSEPAHATLQPGQTRHLPTRVVSLSGPTMEGLPGLPAKDEPLELGDLKQLTNDPVLTGVITRLAEERAPETVAQLVLWRLIGGLDWNQIDRLSNHRWANSSELALARQFVARLGSTPGALPKGESGTVFVEVTTKAEAYRGLADDVKSLLEKSGLLGLNAKVSIPTRPGGPALSCRIVISDAGEANVAMASSDSRGLWTSSGKFSVPVAKDLPAIPDKPEPTAEEKAQLRAGLLADGIAEGMLSRLVRVQLVKGPKDHGKDTFKIRIDNVSPLILNGLALTGTTAEPGAKGSLSALAGFSLPPRKSHSLPASAEMVGRLGLKNGVKAVAADLSGL